jgi:hypothetical protein
MRTVVFRAPSGCANKIAPQFQPHRPLTSYLLGLRPMNAPPRGIFSIAPPIGAPFFMFGGIGLPPLRGPITGDAIGPRGPLPTGGAIGPRGPLLTGRCYWSHCRRRYWPTACPSIRHWAVWYSFLRHRLAALAGPNYRRCYWTTRSSRRSVHTIFSGGTRAIRVSYTHGLSYHLLHCLRPHNAIWGQTMIHLPLHDRFLCNFSKNTIAC